MQLLRENQLLSPARQPEPVRSNSHEGTIIAELPNQMWGTDATTTFTGTEGTVTVFAVIDHCTAECVGIHVVKKATRFEALEPIRQGMKEQLLWVRHFRDLEELRAALIEFRTRYNHHWILQRLNYRTPVQARHDFTLVLQPAA